jgi:hypothetical protein
MQPDPPSGSTGEGNLPPISLYGVGRHFSIAEFACHDGTPVPDEYIQNVVNLCAVYLDPVRQHFGAPVTINSGYRTPAYNNYLHEQSPKSVAVNSQHLLANAADIVVSGHAPHEVYDYIDNYFPPGGLHCYAGFVHVDNRGYKARW